jgi:hypothetical protein
MSTSFKKVLLTAIILITSAYTSQAQSSAKYNELKKAAWLLGSWQQESAKGFTTETWKKLNDSTYQGKSYELNGKDTVSSETIRLEQHGGNLYYVPTVKNQNDGKPVTFTMVKSSAGSLLFENPTHDFPQKIGYTKINKDSLLAEISGVAKGKLRVIKFPMGRVK